MPFTPSHAVVALPFVRTPLRPAAVAVGAMAPDLPLFLRGTPLSYHLTHTDVAVSSVVALVLLALWYAVLRPAVRELSPAALARRLPVSWDRTGRAVWADLRRPRPSARFAGWRGDALFALVLALSLLIGVVSHIVWDAFTHESRWGVRLLPGLEAQWGPLLGYKWLQYGSGVAGLAVLMVAAAVWLHRRRPEPAARVLPGSVRAAWWCSLPLILAAAWVAGLAVHGPLDDEFTVAHLGYLVLPPACAVWGAITIGLALVVQGRRRS